MGKRLLAVVVMASLLVGAAPAHAEPEPAAVGPAGDVPAGKRVTMYALVGLGVAAYGFAGVSLGLQASAASDHDAFPTKNGLKDCLTIAQCDELDATRKREERWGTIAVTSFVVGSAALVSLIAVELFWPHEPAIHAALGPFVTQNGGGGLQVGSSF